VADRGAVMNDRPSCLPKVKERVADNAVAFYCVFGSVWVFIEQTAKLFRIQAAAAQMADSTIDNNTLNMYSISVLINRR
jgi:hypothetical protein